MGWLLWGFQRRSLLRFNAVRAAAPIMRPMSMEAVEKPGIIPNSKAVVTVVGDVVVTVTVLYRVVV